LEAKSLFSLTYGMGVAVKSSEQRSCLQNLPGKGVMRDFSPLPTVSGGKAAGRLLESLCDEAKELSASTCIA
jgi:hypothetical protein